ncbi:MAG: citrate synthase [Bacteroidetes bacterium]|jgi:citrate synthase|nr:citrate synthase [Bacteroidota bacterium]
MSKHNLENITRDEYPYLNLGLEGIVAFSTTKSFIDGQKGELVYSGYTIDTLAEYATFEEVCFLLWNDRLPSKKELDELNSLLVHERKLPKPVLDYICTTEKHAEPMAVLRSSVSMLADFTDPSLDDTGNAIVMTAKIPTIIAAFARARQGLDVVSPLDEGSTAYNFLYMLNGVRPGAEAEKTMDLCLILHAEHGMNASTFTCRAIASTESDIFSAVTGAVGSLKGPLHGGANTAVMNMLLALESDLKTADPVAFTKEKLEKREKIMGFGHRVYKTFDPRARLLRTMSKSLSEETGHEILYEWSEAILKTMKEEKNIDPNVDFFSATVYYSLGIQPDLYTAIFAMSRISGWTAHYLEQMSNNRLVRPRALYVGDKPKEWTEISERS